ncbi:MAG: hypothetical protein HC806_05285 [Anaerolineae bacterium]|nr:hypothetical protein [Anaerolineae bacterium]
MVWLSRVLIIGTFSVAGERLFSQADKPVSSRMTNNHSNRRTNSLPPGLRPASTLPRPAFRPTPKPKPIPRPNNPSYNPRPEPTYHPLECVDEMNPQMVDVAAKSLLSKVRC